MGADSETRTAINDLLEEFKYAVENKNVEALLSTTTKDANMLNIGPAHDEMSIGPAQLKERYEKYFASVDSITVKYGYTTIKANGPVAWVSSHLYQTLKKGSRQLVLDMRMTLVAEKIQDDWKISEMHLSIPGEVKLPEPTPEEKAAEEAAAAAAKAAEEAKKKEEEDKRQAALKADEPPADQSFFDYF
ncbi:nuclear transport factor 2 family protein [Dehalogenimonas sp. THU2]|uniref:nuclear transport factor 2 family protein n=1 Tax=Dehalogenimonas sp. THU2 TaxID=3151121 RepID=UPI0032185665